MAKKSKGLYAKVAHEPTHHKTNIGRNPSKAMLELYKEGIIPHIQIHDELDLSIEDDAQAKKIIEIMEHAVTLEVPNKVDYESGKNWGEING